MADRRIARNSRPEAQLSIGSTVADLSAPRHSDDVKNDFMDVTVSLDDELARFIKDQITVGRFQSSGDLVREASHLMKTVEQQDADGLRWLREAWQEGIESGDAGEVDAAALRMGARARQAAPKS